jgi:transcriptional regulator with XRE-family HTH domain
MVHIGKKIKSQLTVRKISVLDFAKKINTNRNNVYNIFTRQSIDTELLYKICIILNHDFFQYYKPMGEVTPSEERDDFTMPDREWFTKHFKTLNSKIDKLKK